VTKERALAILRLYDGTTEEETAKSVARCERSVRNWLKGWNERGYDGLTPEFDGGPKPKIDGGEWDRIVQEIEGKGMTIRDVEV
jgi:putative transposase